MQRRRRRGWWAVGLALAFGLGACASRIVDAPRAAPREPGLRGEMIHACECDPYCPCPFGKDATYGECRSLTVWVIEQGGFGATDLDGLTFAVSMTKAGPNVARARGSWEGLLLLPERATPTQREALEAFVRREHGDGFARLGVRVLPVSLERETGRIRLSMGETVDLRIRSLPGAGGTVTRIDDPPSHPMGMQTLKCGVAEVHRYDDGAERWDLSGRNAYYGPFETQA